MCEQEERAASEGLTLHRSHNAASGYEGVFLYRVDDEGKILSLRAFWEHERPQPGGDIHPPVGRER